MLHWCAGPVLENMLPGVLESFSRCREGERRKWGHDCDPGSTSAAFHLSGGGETSYVWRHWARERYSSPSKGNENSRTHRAR